MVSNHNSPIILLLALYTQKLYKLLQLTQLFALLSLLMDAVMVLRVSVQFLYQILRYATVMLNASEKIHAVQIYIKFTAIVSLA